MVYITSDWIYKALFHLLLILLVLIQKNNHVSWHLRLEVFLNIPVSLTAIMSKLLFGHFNRYSKSSKFLLNDLSLIGKKERDFSFWGNLNDLIWSIWKYLEFTRFSGSMFCLVEELLNWLNKSAKLGGGFKRTELLLLEISVLFLLSNDKEKSLSFRFQDGRIVLPSWISWSLKVFIVKKVEFVTFQTNPELTYITLDNCISFIDVFAAYFTSEDYISVSWGRYTNDTDRKLNLW